MAEDSDKEDRTESPSARKLEQAREDGNVPRSRELNTFAVTMAGLALLIATGARFIKKLPGIEHALTLCEGVASAEAIRDRVNAMQGGRIALGFGGNPNEASAMRGGPMFELLFGLDTQLRQQGSAELWHHRTEQHQQ